MFLLHNCHDKWLNDPTEQAASFQDGDAAHDIKSSYRCTNIIRNHSTVQNRERKKSSIAILGICHKTFIAAYSLCKILMTMQHSSNWFYFNQQCTIYIYIFIYFNNIYITITPTRFDTFGGLGVSVLPSGTQVRGFKPGRSRRNFRGKNPERAFLRKGSKAMGPMSRDLRHVKDP
jgi:hypothetical protein